jgi:hypothetical protein
VARIVHDPYARFTLRPLPIHDGLSVLAVNVCAETGHNCQFIRNALQHIGDTLAERDVVVQGSIYPTANGDTSGGLRYLRLLGWSSVPRDRGVDVDLLRNHRR